MSQSFGALGVSAEVEQALAARGIVEPFRIQSLVVPDALEGRDILGQAPTGSGKTLAFALPIVELVSAGEPAPVALVLAPTRELALQVTEELTLVGKPKGIRAAAAYGGAPVGPQVKRLRGAHVVVATPGRLNDLVQRRMLSLERIRILILDEADRMLDMGFQPQVDRIVRRLPARRQTMLFSATLDGAVGELARAYTTNPSRFEAELPSRHADGAVAHASVAAPTGSSTSCARGGSMRPRCTATCPRARASARSSVSVAARSRRSSPRTSPQGASTSTRSAT
jgi:superfamily II DNA/RNA helicase